MCEKCCDVVDVSSGHGSSALGGQTKSADSTPLKMSSNRLEHVVRVHLLACSGGRVCTGGLVDVLRSRVERYPDSENSQNPVEQPKLWHLQWSAWRLGPAMALVDGCEISAIAEVLNSIVTSGPEGEKRRDVSLIGSGGWWCVVIHGIHV